MDLSNKNGQPSMEEILASIRRIIAEEPTAANPVIDLHARYRAQKSDDADEGNDFELPSIFRPAAPAPERQPLFGRLTDAIRSASGGAGEVKNGRKDDTESQERYRGALRDSGKILAVSNGQGGLEASSDGTHQAASEDQDRYRGALRDAGGAGSLSSALSSLKLTRGADASPLSDRPEPEMSASATPVHEPAAPVPAPYVAAPAAAPASAGAVEDVRRVMVPFRDMRMSRMNTAPAAPAPESPAVEAFLQSPAQAFAESAVIAPEFPAPPQHHDLMPAFQAAVPPPPSFSESLSLDDMHRFAAVVEQPAAYQPPPPPPQAPPAAAAAEGGIEDTTADLLRPMLRQWLSENMPRMVEKALSIELAESVKSNKKFTG